MELSSHPNRFILIFILLYLAVVRIAIGGNDDNYKGKELWTPCLLPLSTTKQMHKYLNTTLCNSVFQVIQTACSQILGNSSVLEILATSPTASFITSFLHMMSSDHTRLHLNQFNKSATKKRQRANHAAVQGLHTLLTYWHRYKVLILIDSLIDLAPQTIRNLLKAKQIKATVFYLENMANDNIVSKINGWQHVVVSLNEQNMQIFINKANEQKLFSTEFVSWIFITTNISMNVWSKINRPRSQINLLIANVDVKGITSPDWQSFNLTQWSIHPNAKPHLPAQCRTENKAIKLIQVKLTDNFLDAMATASQLGLFDVFHSNQTGQTEILQIGLWRPATGLKFFTNLNDIDPQHHLRGRQIKIITFEEQPYLFINNESNAITMSGYLYELLTIIVKHLNMEPKIEIASKAVTGIEVSPGNYSGVVGTLYRREADLALASLGMTVSRRPAIRFSSPIITEMYLSIFLRRPPLGISYTDYFDVFSRRLWISILVTLSLALTAMLAVAYFRPIVITTYDNLSTTPMKTVVRGVKHRIYWVFSGMFFEEVTSFTYGKASKIVVGFFLFATLIVYSYYTTALTSFLIHQLIKLPFENMEELVHEHPNYRIALVAGSNHFDHFRNSHQGLYSKVWESVNDKRKLFDVVFDIHEGLDKVYHDNHVLFADGPSGKYLSRDNDSFTFLDVNYFHEFSHYPIRTDFPYHKIISSTLQKLNENGVLDVLSKRYFPFLKKVQSRSSETDTLGLHQVITLFMIPAVGLASCLFALILEVIIEWKF